MVAKRQIVVVEIIEEVSMKQIEYFARKIREDFPEIVAYVKVCGSA